MHGGCQGCAEAELTPCVLNKIGDAAAHVKGQGGLTTYSVRHEKQISQPNKLKIFVFVLAALQGIQNLSSSTRDQTPAPWQGKHRARTSREVLSQTNLYLPEYIFKIYFKNVSLAQRQRTERPPQCTRRRERHIVEERIAKKMEEI